MRSLKFGPVTSPSARCVRRWKTLMPNLTLRHVPPFAVYGCPLLLKHKFCFVFTFFSSLTCSLHVYMCIYVSVHTHTFMWDFHGITKWKTTIMPIFGNFSTFKIVNNVVSPFRIGLSSYRLGKSPGESLHLCQTSLQNRYPLFLESMTKHMLTLLIW